MKKSLLGVAVVVACAAAVPSHAVTTLLTATGTIAGNAYTANLNLDIVNGQAQSGTGTFTFLTLNNAPLALITTSTPGNQTTGGPQYPVGFRANDGTDIYAADQAYPLTIGGLLFAVGTTTPAPGQNPLINFYNDGGTLAALFTGTVGTREIYATVGTLAITNTPAGNVPEPASWALMLVGFGAVGSAMRRGRRVRVNFA